MIPRLLIPGALVLTLLACQETAPRLPFSPAQTTGALPTTLTGTGRIHLVIRWPDAARSIQLIPDSTRIVDLRVLQEGKTVATASLRFPGTEVTLGPVPSGPGRLEAEAFHLPLAPVTQPGPEHRVATGSAEVLIETNRNVNATLTLDPTRVPKLDWLEPEEGRAGESVKLVGSQLKAPPGGETVLIINGTRIASSDFQVFENSLSIPSLPDLGDTLTLRLLVDGVAANKTLTYQVLRVKSLSLTPPILILQRIPDSDEYAGSFTATAFRNANKTSPLSEPPAGLTWEILDEDPPRANPTDASIFEIRDSTVIARGTVPATATVRVYLGDEVEATASAVFNPS
jgi:hypothetical protein